MIAQHFSKKIKRERPKSCRQNLINMVNLINSSVDLRHKVFINMIAKVMTVIGMLRLLKSWNKLIIW